MARREFHTRFAAQIGKTQQDQLNDLIQRRRDMSPRLRCAVPPGRRSSGLATMAKTRPEKHESITVRRFVKFFPIALNEFLEIQKEMP